jgi:hypothetical protein
MYKIKILKETSHDTVKLQLSALEDRWEAEVLRKLADLMQKHEISRLHLPIGKTYFEITHFPLDYLKGLLSDLEKLGFSVGCL